MKTEHKLIAALAILVVLVAGFLFSRNKQKQEDAAHTATGAAAELPVIALPKDDGDKITKIEIKNADKSNVTLEKKGDAWELTAPVSAKAEQSNIKSLLDNLKELKVKESIARFDDGASDRPSASSAPNPRSAELYKQYDLTDEKALHVVAYKGADKAVDLYFGKSGSRGQVMRVGGKDGVWVADKYSSYLYTREVKNWRERTILKFEDANAIQVSVENKNGAFSFSKNDDKWSATFTARDKDGKLKAQPEAKWDKFEPEKVKDMLRAYKSLNAEDFGDDKSDTGFADAANEGGIVKIKLKDNAGDFTIKVGKVSKGTSRYAQKEGSDIVYTISSWSADWATAAQSKFEKSDKKDEPAPHDAHDDMEAPE